MKKQLIILCLLFSLIANVKAQTTKIWIVRHAEKETINPKESNPPLTKEGLDRAKDLENYLAKEKIAYLYATNYLRTEQTLSFVAKQKGIAIKNYDSKNNDVFVKELKSLPKGKNVVIVGHSNTIIPLAKSLGAMIPFDTLNDDDYDFIFELKIKDYKVKTSVLHYGQKHHSTLF